MIWAVKTHENSPLIFLAIGDEHIYIALLHYWHEPYVHVF